MAGNRPLGFCTVAILIVFATTVTTAEDLTIHKASQCFKSRGIPKVQFDCANEAMIKINRAFHGIKTHSNAKPWEMNCDLTDGQESHNCSNCPGDCMDDSMNLVYDWSTCMGNASCIRTVMQSYMPTCQGTTKKFSDYLQVEYQCVPKKKVYNICEHLETTVNDGFIMSPNYPHNYPTNKDCICKLSTQWESRIVLSLVDLLLETKNSRCRADWMMLRQNNQKHRHCGAIMTGVKNITSTGNALAIQFHSDGNDNRSQKFQYFTRSLKGFWMSFTAEPKASVRIACRTLTSVDSEVKEIAKDDAEYDEILSTRAMETTPMMTTDMNDVGKKDGKGAGPKGPPSRGDKGRRKIGNKWKNAKSERGHQDGTNLQESSAGQPTTTLTILTVTIATIGYLVNLL